MNEVRQQASRIVVRGVVQGVGFRYFTQQSARSLGLCGWVRNLPDGTVEIQVSGEEEKLERFRTQLRKGPALGRVDDVAEERIESSEAWQEFEVRYQRG